MKQETPDLIAEQKMLLAQVKYKIGLLESNNELEPIVAIQHDKTKLLLERIKGTTKYLANFRKVIYDLSFLELYNFDYRILQGCMAIGYHMFKITGYSHINNPEAFLALLDSPQPKSIGTKFYLDNVLYLDNVPFIHADSIRNDLLQERKDGIRWFDCLKIIDPSGNETLFYPSEHMKKIHNLNGRLKKFEEGN